MQGNNRFSGTFTMGDQANLKQSRFKRTTVPTKVNEESKPLTQSIQSNGSRKTLRKGSAKRLSGERKREVSAENPNDKAKPSKS
jgi:hypothetical protein